MRANGLAVNRSPFPAPRTMKRAPARTEDALRKLIEVSATSDTDDMFRAAAEQFYFTCRVKNLAEKTLSTYGERLENFRRFLDLVHVPFEQVEKPTIQRYILSMKDRVSDHTVNDRIRALKTFFKFLITEGIWNSGRPNPMDGIQYIRTESRFKPVLCQEEVEKLLKVPNRRTFTGFRNFCILYVLWDSLIRLSELINIKIEDIDFKAGTLRVMGKGRKERRLPLGGKTLRHLHSYLLRFRSPLPGTVLFCTRQGLPMQKRHLQHVLERIGKRVDVHVTPHLMRHSAASHLALTGIPAFMLQRMLGHTSLNTTRMYIHLINDEKLRQVFQQFSPGDGLRL